MIPLPRFRTAPLGLVVLVLLAAAGLALVGPAAGGSTGPVDSGSWTLTLDNASTLSVTFTPEPSDPPPTFFYRIDVGLNRTADNRSFAGGLVWNETKMLHGGWRFVNEDEARVGVRVRGESATVKVADGAEPIFDGSKAGGWHLLPDRAGPTYELTLLAVPASPMHVNLTMPGGGTVDDVDRDPGEAHLVPYPDFDEREGVRSVPGPYRFEETATADKALVAVGRLGGRLPVYAGQYHMETPEGCEASNRYAITPLAHVDHPDVSCPPDVDPNLRVEPSVDTLYYRGVEPGSTTFSGTAVEDHGGRGTFLATGEIPPD